MKSNEHNLAPSNIGNDIDMKTLFTTSYWLPKFIKSVQMWIIINNQAPLYLQGKFAIVRQIHDKQIRKITITRHYMPKYKLDYGNKHSNIYRIYFMEWVNRFVMKYYINCFI